MRVIMISTDRNIFIENSPVANRMIEYGRAFGELHIIVFCLDKFPFAAANISAEVTVYPTRSQSKWKYIGDAVRIGRGIAKTIYFGQTVITAEDPFAAGIVGVSLKKKTKLPLQIQIHTDIFAKQFYDGSFFNWVCFEVSRYTLPKADGIRVVRDKIGDDIVRYRKVNPKKITILPVLVDIKKLREKAKTIDLKAKYPEFKDVILMASRLAPEKSVATGIRSFAKISSNFPELGLIVVGSGPEEDNLKALSRNLNIAGKVRFEGWQDDLVSYYKAASIYLNTSLYEGYCMALVEAAALGCPILTSYVGIAQDLFKDNDNALVCAVGDEPCFAHKLTSFFGSPTLQKSIAEAGFETMTRYIISPEKYLQKYKEALESILVTK